IEDLRRVLDEVEDDAVGVYGASFGGLVAIHTAVRDDRIDALALRDPVTFMEALDDIREEIREQGYYEQLPGKRVDERFLEDLEQYSTATIIGRLQVPTLVMHGTEDEVVDVELSERFVERLTCVKRFDVFEGEGHRFSDEADDEAVLTALDWFASH
ncbi:MAG: YqiA/YcfP family alpha/beta fold hydrolase, partial [Candidatus Nanohaloarchaea archaeon]|nr:YqiA/YcfP family alpha/beta fold hydrolase [Candidatus Nanohaloarchaea archaeon]